MAQQRLEDLPSRQFKPQADNSPFWAHVREGLNLFRIPVHCVKLIVGIPIELSRVTQHVLTLDAPSRRGSNHKPLALLVGDAAFRVHFWPGRGLNSGIKSVIAVARRTHAAYSQSRDGSLTITDFARYEGFMAELRTREQEGRSVPVLEMLQNGHACGIEARLKIALDEFSKGTDASAEYLKRLQTVASRLQTRDNWVHKGHPIDDKLLEEVVYTWGLHKLTINSLHQSGTWPLSAMAGEEVSPSSFCADPLKSFRKSQSHEPLHVIISGGGPCGLILAATLAEYFGDNIKIRVYEQRWKRKCDNSILWRGEREGNRRRRQVVTIQDDVAALLPPKTEQYLFSRIGERVWPTSRNIPIKEVEDRMLERVHQPDISGSIELFESAFDEERLAENMGWYDLLIGADGGRSFVRQHCNFATTMANPTIERTIGIAYEIPEHEPPPLHQALNIVLTVSQTRYLLNSHEGKRGFLNMRLTEAEWAQVKGVDGRPATYGEPCLIFDELAGAFQMPPVEPSTHLVLDERRRCCALRPPMLKSPEGQNQSKQQDHKPPSNVPMQQQPTPQQEQQRYNQPMYHPSPSPPSSNYIVSPPMNLPSPSTNQTPPGGPQQEHIYYPQYYVSAQHDPSGGSPGSGSDSSSNNGSLGYSTSTAPSPADAPLKYPPQCQGPAAAQGAGGAGTQPDKLHQLTPQHHQLTPHPQLGLGAGLGKVYKNGQVVPAPAPGVHGWKRHVFKDQTDKMIDKVVHRLKK